MSCVDMSCLSSCGRKGKLTAAVLMMSVVDGLAMVTAEVLAAICKLDRHEPECVFKKKALHCTLWPIVALWLHLGFK